MVSWGYPLLSNRSEHLRYLLRSRMHISKSSVTWQDAASYQERLDLGRLRHDLGEGENPEAAPRDGDATRA